MLHALTLSVALTAVPGDFATSGDGREDSTRPTTRRLETRNAPASDSLLWQAYCQEVDRLWVEYQAAGSTDQGFAMYQAAASEAKRRYVYGDMPLPMVPA